MTNPTRLVVLHQGAIGDFVLALSVIQTVRTTLQAEHVVAIATAASAKLAAGCSAIDAHQWPEQVGLHTLFLQSGPIDGRLALYPFQIDLARCSAPVRVAPCG